jgi:hypothetical protein
MIVVMLLFTTFPVPKLLIKYLPKLKNQNEQIPYSTTDSVMVFGV